MILMLSMAFQFRSEIPAAYTWDLDSFYASLAKWEEEFAQAEKEVLSVQRFRGKLGDGPSVLKEAVEEYLKNLRRIERLYTFAHLRSDEDTTNAANLALLDRSGNLYSRFTTAASYFVPELLTLPEATADSLLQDAQLAPFKRMLREILRYRSHTLSQDEESLLAQGSEVFASTERIFSQLNNADLEFGTITIDGQEKALTHGSFVLFLKNSDPEVRRKTFRQFYDVFDKHRNVITATLGSALKTDAFLARARKYPSALDKALFPDEMPHAVYDGLIDTASTALPSLHEYYGFRKTHLGLKQLTLADTHVPLVEDVKTHISYEEAVEIILDALAPLGNNYLEILRRGLKDERWVDVFETKGKRSGAYSSGCYDSRPFMLLNYKEDHLSDLFTFAHEIGHSMHSALTREKQPYQDHQFGIFLAEVASTFNEQLLLAHLRKRYKSDPKMLAYLVNHQLDEIKGTFYRQTMFAEFELKTHELVRQNQPLTTETLSEIYTALLKKYFGDAVEIGERDWLECLRIPHFYSAFYVYKYATGISAAIALSEKVLAGEKGAVDRYTGFLQAGCSLPPIEILRAAGVDMLKPDAVRATTQVFAQRLEDLKSILTTK